MATHASVRCVLGVVVAAALAHAARADDPPADPEQAVLDAALTAARDAPDPEAGALAAASVAWTAVRRERPDLARSAAAVALGLLEQVVESGEDVHLRVRARLGAVLVWLDDGRAAAPHFAAGVTRPAPPSVLAAWIRAFADAAAHRAPTSGEHLKRMFAAIERLEGGEQAWLLREAAPDLRRLGAAEQARALGEALLERELPLESLADLVAALADLGGGRLSPGSQERVWTSVLAAEADELGDFVPPMVAAVLGEAEGDPWEAANKLGHALEERGGLHGALLCRQAAVVYLARLGAPTARARVALERVLDLAWAHGREADADWEADLALERMNVLGPTTRSIARLVPPAERVALLRRERDRALEKETDAFVLRGLLGSCALAAGDLEGDAEALKLVTELVDALFALHDQAAAKETAGEEASASPIELVEALGPCAQAASTIATDGAAPLVERIARRARAALEGLSPERRAEATLEGLVFVPAELLVTCAAASAKLGDATTARQQLTYALDAVRAADPGDRALIVAAALGAAKALVRSDRLAIATTAMEIVTATTPDLTEAYLWEEVYGALDGCLTVE